MSQMGQGSEQFTTWWSRNAHGLGVSLRIAFGVVWLIDGAMKFAWLAPSDVTNLVQTAGQGQPSWLASWFNFWVNLITSNAAFAPVRHRALGTGPWVRTGIRLHAQVGLSFRHPSQPPDLFGG